MEFAVDIDALVTEASGGSSRAFAELVRLHQANIRYFLARFTDDPGVVDDLAQEVFLTAFRNLGQFKKESSFSTWLHGIAKNKALSFLKSESRRMSRDRNLFEAALLEWQSNSIDRQSDDNQSHYLDWLSDCLNGLTPTGKEIIQQYYYQGKSSDEVGEVLSKGGGAIRMMLVRIRRALLKCLNKKKNQLQDE